MCLAFNCNRTESLVPIKLDGNPLLWKKSAKHIGNILSCDGTMEQDLRVKRGQFINNCMSLNNEFEHLSYDNQIRLLNIYNSHFTGSNLWNFESNMFNQLTNSWNVNLKVVMDIPVQTHTWIVEELSGTPSARKMIYKRFLKFAKSILNIENRPAIASLAKKVSCDVRTLTGGNLRKISLDAKEPIIPGVTGPRILNNLVVNPVPEGQKWRIPLLHSLFEMRNENWIVVFDEDNEECLE